MVSLGGKELRDEKSIIACCTSVPSSIEQVGGCNAGCVHVSIVTLTGKLLYSHVPSLVPSPRTHG